MKQITKLLLCLFAAAVAISCEPAANDEGTTGGAEEVTLELIPSTNNVIAGKDAWVEFTAFIGETDVTYDESLTIYLRGANGKGVPINDLAYEITDLGDYTFFAICVLGDDTPVSKDVVVKGVTANLDAATDDEPTNFGPFKKRTLGFQFTGLWCGNCPFAIKAIHNFADSDKADDLVMVAVHNGDVMTSAADAPLREQLKTNGWPYMTIGGLTNAQSSHKSNVYTEAYIEFLETSTAKILETAPLTGISAVSRVISGVICVRADIKVNRDGVYGIGAMIVEDDVYGQQKNDYSSEDLDLTGININLHENVLRTTSPNGVPFYEELGGVDKHKANTVYTQTWDFDTNDPKLGINKIENCRVIIFTQDKTTYSKDETTYVNRIDNVVQFEAGSGKSFEYAE